MLGKDTQMMFNKYLGSGGGLRAACALLLMALVSACGAKATPTPTALSVEAVYTAAFQTLMAQQATQQALTPPTSTPLPPTGLPTLALTAAPLPTFAFTTPTPGGAIGGGGTGACDNSAFVADVTIPDNSTINPGKAFTKTWQLLNNGTCTWDTTYKLAFLSGDQMGGTTTPLTSSVGPGSSLNISVKLTAPTTNGTYKGVWQMQNGSNQNFGVQPYVLIKVGGGATATPGPSPTAGATCSSTCTITISANVVDFRVTISGKAGATACNVPSGGTSCTFTVPVHWDGTVTLSKGTYTFSPSSYAFTDVTRDQGASFTGTPGTGKTATPTP